jgi:hypothetical protein
MGGPTELGDSIYSDLKVLSRRVGSWFWLELLHFLDARYLERYVLDTVDGI